MTTWNIKKNIFSEYFHFKNEQKLNLLIEFADVKHKQTFLAETRVVTRLAKGLTHLCTRALYGITLSPSHSDMQMELDLCLTPRRHVCQL